MLQRGDELRAQFGVVAEPVQQLRPAPFGGVDAAAPVDSFKACATVEGVRSASYFGRLAGGAVVAPEVVFAQRDEILADRDDAGAGGIERDGPDLFAVDATGPNGLVHGADQRVHLVVVRLRLEVRIGGGTVEWILGDGGPKFAPFLREDGNAYAKRAEVDPSHYTHFVSPLGFA